MVAYEVRSYTGNAADTVLNANINATSLTFSVAPGTGGGYPDGSQGPFYVFLDYDTSGIEKVRCTGRINDTFTIPDTASRGVDGTTAQAHNANAKVRHGWTATDAQEANRAAANTVGKVTTKGDLLVATSANTLARLPVGVDGAPLVADSTQTTGLRFDNAAWTSYTPTFANFTLGNGTTSGRYKQVAPKVVFMYALVTLGSTSSFGAGQVIVASPTVAANTINQYLQVRYFNNTAASSALGYGELIANSGSIGLWAPTSNTTVKIDNFLGTVIGSALTASGSWVVTGMYESA